MSKETDLLHCRVETGGALPAVTPLYQTSAFEAKSPYFYTRNSNPNIAELESLVAALEGARHAIAMTTGMAAISNVLHLLSPGDTLVANQHIYGCTYKLLQRFAAFLRLELVILDLSTEPGMRAIPRATRMVIFETPTNPFLKTVDIAAVCEAVKSRNDRTLVVVDNTWATPLYQRPLERGADISLHSATKYFSGHSDVMGGVLLTDRANLHDELRSYRFYNGTILDPHSAWLLRRSMQTFAMRMAHHYQATAEIRDFLATCPQVRRVYYPHIDGTQLTGYGALIFFDLREDLVAHYGAFARSLRYFGTGTGMACVTSMVAQPYTGSHASMTPEEKAAMGLDQGLVRLSIGLENLSDLKEDLAQALAAINEMPVERLPAVASREG